ncbi:MAG: hypothetical protein ACI30W_05865 [Muribaculaceae bacterium]
MKNLLKYAIMAFAAVALTTSCGNDDPDPDEPDVPGKDAGTFVWALGVSQSFMDCADITVSITDPKGNTKDELLNASNCNAATHAKYGQMLSMPSQIGGHAFEPITLAFDKTMTFDTYPATITVKVTAKAKEGYDASAKYSLSAIPYAMSKVGTTAWSDNPKGGTSAVGMDGAHLGEWFDRHSASLSATFTINADGTVSFE